MPDRSPPASHPAVSAAAGYVLKHPFQVFVVDWNWKTALLSALFRAAVWPFHALLHRGSGANTLRGLCLEFVFRLAVGGFWGSLLQAFSDARPAWLACLCLAILLPGCMHSLEYLALWAGGVMHAGFATAVSFAVSVISFLVNWRLMRRGILLTGHGASSLIGDARRIYHVLTKLPAAEKATAVDYEESAS